MSVIEVAVGSADNPFVISSECDDLGVQWSELILPEWSLRMTYAPPSAYVQGNVLLGAVEDSGEVTMLVTVQGSSMDDLQDRKAELKAALMVWPGEVLITLVEDDVSTPISGPWQSFPTLPRWGDVRALLHGVYLQDCTFSIPVNPHGAP